jgi:histone H3/H4
MAAVITGPTFQNTADEMVLDKAVDKTLRKRRVPPTKTATLPTESKPAEGSAEPAAKNRKVGKGEKAPVLTEGPEPIAGDPEGQEEKVSQMIVAKAIREYVKTNHQMHLNAAVLQKVNSYIQNILWKSAQRAKANGRKTIKVSDM